LTNGSVPGKVPRIISISKRVGCVAQRRVWTTALTCQRPGRNQDPAGHSSGSMTPPPQTLVRRAKPVQRRAQRGLPLPEELSFSSRKLLMGTGSQVRSKVHPPSAAMSRSRRSPLARSHHALTIPRLPKIRCQRWCPQCLIQPNLRPLPTSWHCRGQSWQGPAGVHRGRVVAQTNLVARGLVHGLWAMSEVLVGGR